MKLPTSILIAATLIAAQDVQPPPGPDAAVGRFLAETTTPLSSAVTFRHLEATARGGSMRGWLDTCTVLDGNAMRYAIVDQGGSGAVRKRALIAALDGEVKARQRGETSRASLHPDNYQFSAADTSGDLVRVELTPRRNDTMLIRGSMYLAPANADLVRVEGALVKSPSIWTRRVRVDRRYARIGGVRVPVSMTSTAQVFIVGESTFSMAYNYLSINGERVVDPTAPAAAQACGTASSIRASREESR